MCTALQPTSEHVASMVCLTVYNECSGLLCAGITWTGLQQGDQALNPACCLQHLLLLQGLHHLHGVPDVTAVL